MMNRAFALVFAGVGCTEPVATHLTTFDQEATCGTGPTVKGIDVSKYQGTIDWAAVKNDGVEFAFVRVSDGLTFIDAKFDANWTGSRAQGVLHGAYQFFRPEQDPIAQADLLLSRMGPLQVDDLPPVIDVEADGGLPPDQVAASVRIWVEHVTAAIGRAPIIYTGFYFWRSHVGTEDFTSSPLWHAQYSSAECPTIAPPWTDWAFWQYTSSGSVAGITGNVDTNRFNGTREQLMELTGTTRTCGMIDPSGGTIDDGDACFTPGGPQQYLRHVASVGEGADLMWTHTTDRADEDNFGQWNLVFAEPGRYQVEVSTPAAYAQSRQAHYVIHANGAEQDVAIDQTAVDGWQSLGEVDFAAGGDQFVHLSDNTGEPLASNTQLVFDSVRVTRVGVGSGSGSGSGSGDGDQALPGGCNVGGGSGAGLALLGLALGLRRRPTRRS
ncbi:MAG: Lyzozyme (1,4-beta-N-acetylmuramidase) [Deltaproteobacteria bacterium]|nr:Lyzozyme (1,4-beta-N-acetylmuramidase) [Deltaproteobacteria bacterium]